MATLRNVPDELVRLLKQEATHNRRSLRQEVLMRLASGKAVYRRGGAETVNALRRLHKRFARLPLLTDTFLSRAKDEGRL